MTAKPSRPPPPLRERVLLVDDETLVRTMTRTVLGFAGYQVVEAEDGVEAVEKFRSASPKIELALLDYHLPRMNGHEVLVQIREMDPKLPAVILSGGLHEGIGATGLDGVAFLHKPFQNDELLRVMRDLLEARGGKGV